MESCRGRDINAQICRLSNVSCQLSYEAIDNNDTGVTPEDMEKNGCPPELIEEVRQYQNKP